MPLWRQVWPKYPSTCMTLLGIERNYVSTMKASQNYHLHQYLLLPRMFETHFLVKATLLNQMWNKGISPRYFNSCSYLYMWINRLLNMSWTGLLMLLLMGRKIPIIHSSKIDFHVQDQLFFKKIWSFGYMW